MCKPEFDESIVLADNAMLKIRPELFNEWDFEKNNKLGLDIYKFTISSNKVAWWNCPKCGSNYDTRGANRKNGNCPYCRGLRINHTNSLETLNPIIALEWHPTKNKLKPSEVAIGSHKKAWWLGKCGHEWEANINNRARKINGRGCPYCSKQEILIGYSDMWTTHPEIAQLLFNPEDGYKFMRMSNKKADFKCTSCGNIIKNKVIASILKEKIFCNMCSDGVSYPEKFLHEFLKQVKINYTPQKVFGWLSKKRYDFYLDDYNFIIEVHGKQHYTQSFNGQYKYIKLQDVQVNDNLKMKKAIENGVDQYIVIDARSHRKVQIQESIEKSILKNLVDIQNVDWESIHLNAVKSYVQRACDLWNDGLEDLSLLSVELGVSVHTISKYLRDGNKLKLCKYPKMSRKDSATESRRRDVVQLTLDGDFVKHWKIIADVERELGIHQSSVGQCCKGKSKTAGGFRWMYKEDYETL